MSVASWWPWLLGAVLAAILVLIGVMVRVLRAAHAKGPMIPAPADAARGQDTSVGELGVIALRRSFATAMTAFRQLAPHAADRLDTPWVLAIGRAGAGKSTLLEGLTLDRLGPQATQGEAVGDAPCRWHFFERGVVLDLSGALFDSRTGFGADVVWRTFVNLLHRYRAARPADAIVLAVPCTDLVGPQRLSRTALDDTADRLRTRIADLHHLTGLQLPVYVVVTQCDRIPGFGAFARCLPPENRQQILGWSSPYAVESAFSPAWIDEAMTVVLRGIQDAGLAALCEPSAVDDADELVLLPSRISASAAALRELLTRTFKPTAYDPAFTLRGVYFTGDSERGPAPATSDLVTADATVPTEPPGVDGGAALEIPAPVQRTRIRPAFAADLFNDKIFGEHGLATPLRRWSLSANRKVAVMQVAAAAIVVLGPPALWASVNGIRLGSVELSTGVRRQVESITPLLRTIDSLSKKLDSAEEQPGGGAPFATEGDAVFTLLNDMAGVSTGRVGSVLLPASIVSPLHADIPRAIQSSLEGVVLPELRRGLSERKSRLLRGENDAGQLGASGSLPQYLVELRALADAVNHFNRLARPGYGTTRDMGGLIQYLYADAQIVPAFYEHDTYYGDALARAHVAPMVIAPNEQSLAAKRAVYLAGASYDAVVSRLGGLSIGADSSRETPMDGLRADVAAVAGLRAFLDTAGPVERTLGTMRPPFVFGNEFSTNVERALGVYRERLTGQLSSRSGDRSIEATLRSLDVLLRQRFMQSGSVAGRAIPGSVDPDAGLRWDIPRLDEAIGLHGSFETFALHGFDSLPPGVRGSVRRLAGAQLALVMAQLVADAAVPAAASGSGGTRAENLRELRARTTAFEQSASRLTRLIDMFDGLGATAMVDSLDEVATAQAATLLAQLDAAFGLAARYTVPTAAIAAWDGRPPFSATAFAAGTGQSLADYLTGEEESIRAATQIAEPVVVFLASRDHPPTATARSVRTWTEAIDAVERLDRKPPAGPLANLDRTVAAVVDSIDVRTCARRPLRIGPGGPDFLSRRLDDFRHAVWRRCAELATASARATYTHAETFFRDHLAGKFPFTNGAAGDDASPADVVEFLRDYDAVAADKADIVAGASAATGQRVARFIDDVAAVRAFFAPLIDSLASGRGPAYDYRVDFRVNRASEAGANQIADWTLDVGAQHAAIGSADAARRGRWHAGDSLALTLRWASGSTVVPLELIGGGETSPRDGTATVRSEGEWGMLRLLRAHESDMADPEGGQTVMLMAHMVRRNSATEPGPTARAFVRIRLFNPDSKAELRLPRFPVLAPSLTTEERR